MPFGYVIAQIDVTDPAAYPDYVAMVGPVVARFGGEFLVRGGRAEYHEGEPPGRRTVVIRFPSFEAARDWYHSEDYAAAKLLRQRASTSVQTIVEGV
ncbi:DUF1330 domain-containing protein [Paralimibaculum aggregatum]|uniref:DUF1330 domain-containing protein n=1 Tax=Paralimibaculum aggregatum TaxID=3036245 RepID=A0ABQ6LMZ4_9RHOB|nr:DUF1330 domain-containing protein [Limibaculum sp. NKW23]GMG84589.1 DUF1330 domain-containing protein [Limibaculum sp. NKW23]